MGRRSARSPAWACTPGRRSSDAPVAEFARTFVLTVGGGSTREIASPEEALAEIAAGALRRETLVVAYEGGRGRSLRAGDAPELRPLFDAGLGSARARPGAPAVAAAPVAPAAPGGPGPAVASGPPPAAPTAPQPASSATERRRGLGCLPTLLVWLVAAGAAVWLLSFCVRRAGAELAYVTRPTVLRAGPSAAAPARGDLPRGAPVRGAPDARDDAWFRVAGARGGHVWRRNLSSRRRPALTGGPAPRRAAGPALLRAEADAGAAVVGRVARGEALHPAGVTQDGWVELRLPGGGVGYLRR